MAMFATFIARCRDQRPFNIATWYFERTVKTGRN
jgi:hypothetical protein